jgi:hypothetical protein
MGEWMYSSTFLDLGTSWRWVVSFTPRPFYPLGNSPRYPLDRRLGGPHSWSGRRGEEKILTLPGLELRPLCRPARSPSLYRLRYRMYVCMNEWGMGQKIRPLHCDPQWSIVLTLLINPLLILHLEWSVGLCLWGRHSSHLVPWKTGPGDEIVNKMNHVTLGTSCTVVFHRIIWNFCGTHLYFSLGRI